MLLNFCIIILLLLLANYLMGKIRLPGLLGMLLIGILVGPYCLNFLHPIIIQHEVMNDLKTFALIVILLRAGLGLKKESLHKVGKTAIFMSFIPGIFEGTAIMIISTYLLDFSWFQGGILGFIIAAVSPAVVVPQMLELKEKRLGEDKQIPTLILAGASVDDVFAITIYSTFLSLYLGKNVNITEQIIKIPISIILGIGCGIIIGFILYYLFKKLHIRDTKKVLILLAVCVCFNALNAYINTLLGIMTVGFILLEKIPVVANRLSDKMNKVWVFAEMLLFLLIGAQVNISVAMKAGLMGIIIIAVGLIFRSIGVIIATFGSNLNFKEKLFCIISYIPKATVQAAIGSVPLAKGVAGGEWILAIAVLAILITAPLGSIGIRLSSDKFLDKNIEDGKIIKYY
ncbi:MAG: cation:proton antiporter [Vallitalea sp.]|nr:cation:proton antiporter [Vallitalea sp.]